MRTLKLAALAVAVLLPISGFAAKTVTCEEFVAMTDVDKPKLVYYGLGHFQGGEDYGMVDIVNTDQLVPVIVEACKATPKASLWDKLKEKVK